MSHAAQEPFSRIIQNVILLFPNCRWVLVYFPHSSDRIFTRKRSKIYIAICWTLPILIMLPSLTGTWGWHALDCRTRTCTIMDLEEGYPFKKFLFNFGVSFPSLALVVTNVMIYAKVSVNFILEKLEFC